MLAIVVFYGALMRYVVKDMPSWAYEISIFMYGILSFCSGAYCLLHDKHVSVDIIKGRLSPKLQRNLDVMYAMVTIICIAIISYYAICWAIESTLILERSEHQTAFNPQIWWFKWTVVIALIMLILQAISSIMKHFKSGGDI